MINEDNEMEQRENEAIADFYATITTLYLNQLKSHSFSDDTIVLELLDDVDMKLFIEDFKEDYQDYWNFDKLITVEFRWFGVVEQFQIQ